ncbi:MAG: glycine cleavage system protein H, partial [Thermoprotei archaeon]
MMEYKGCVFPDGLLYDVDYHVWVRLENGLAVVGATSPGQAYAGEIIFIKVKDKGTTLERGAIAATLESAKYMGPMRTPLSGTITHVNEDVKNQPTLINQAPYESWVFKLAPTKLEAERALLLDSQTAA